MILNMGIHLRLQDFDAMREGQSAFRDRRIEPIKTPGDGVQVVLAQLAEVAPDGPEEAQKDQRDDIHREGDPGRRHVSLPGSVPSISQRQGPGPNCSGLNTPCTVTSNTP